MITACYSSGVEFKDWVKAERERRGWTQQELADHAGIDRVEANALETGRNKGTSARIREGLAKAFKIPITRVGGGTSVERDDYSQIPLDRTALGSHRDFDTCFAEFERRMGDDYDPDIKAAVAQVSFGMGVPEFIDWRLIKTLADAEMQVRRLKAVRAQKGGAK
jgi:transcriptional regulator with XRE-family HTH domain